MTKSVSESWKSIAAWMQTNSPEEWESIQGPASSEELANAAKEFGIELPDDFVQLYKLMNATDPDKSGELSFYPSVDKYDEMAFSAMALEHAVQEWKMMKELVEGGEFKDSDPESVAEGVANEFWNFGWIPFAHNGAGDYYIDMAPTKAGKKGQVITHSHETGNHQLIAPSLADYLADIADMMNKGECEYDECYGIQKKNPVEA